MICLHINTVTLLYRHAYESCNPDSWSQKSVHTYSIFQITLHGQVLQVAAKTTNHHLIQPYFGESCVHQGTMDCSSEISFRWLLQLCCLFMWKNITERCVKIQVAYWCVCLCKQPPELSTNKLCKAAMLWVHLMVRANVISSILLEHVIIFLA